jgi:REP element-mobilizing transposase RayT
MPDHVHLLIRKHRHKSEEMIERLQAASRESTVACGQRDPLHPVWTHGAWKGSLETIEEIRRTIRYIELNPVKIGLPQQHWDFVSPYNGWLPMQITRVKPPRNNRER